ncbi:hypothetical protein [Flavobacterium sp. 7A]|uniref:hypothetical protein n=1 Tax=Flavobacterium sp. 7A TaxID=2940571 RepID=UPI002227A1A9|nr:hypothetical protein [Flavobacterium sp. 7A]MCW2117762.1 hypothetical protein [Flavobacterium sp. 7A]
MKKHILLYLLFISGLTLSAQNFYLKIKGNTLTETSIIDSTAYQSKHSNLKAISQEIEKTTQKLLNIGFITTIPGTIIKKNDSTYTSSFVLGKQTKYIHIYIGTNPELRQFINPIKNDSITVPYIEIKNFLSSTLQKAEKKGYALAKINLSNIKKQQNNISANLLFTSGTNRIIDEIIVKQDPNDKKNILPPGHLKQLNLKFKKQIFNKSTVLNIYQDVQKYRFMNQIKFPEILLLQDSTKIYVYLEKRKSNTFDGYLGFNTGDNNKLIINGYLDLKLENTLNAGEQFSLYWKTDGKNQKTFTTNLEVPYIFNSNIGLKAQINIFKQDSIFQNTKTAADIGYLINYNSRLYIGVQFTESSDIQNSNNTTVKDYKNSFFTANYEYTNYDYNRPLFPQKSSLSIKTGFGKRTNNDLSENSISNKQLYIDLKASFTFQFNLKNYLYLNLQNYLLKSPSYFTNELYRFGGTANIRGFAENSLQAQFLTSIITEYRYVVSPNLYLHSIFDYSVFKDPFSTTDKSESITGIGIGLGIQTKNGLLKLTFANGVEKQQKTNLSNTIVSLNYNIQF